MEEGGYPTERLRGSKTGVFTGISTNDYGVRFADHGGEIDPYWTAGNASSMSANRLSYFFDFRGPSLAIDTACSSSLVAVHMACNSLRAGECEMAVATGVNVILSPAISLAFAKAGGFSPDGRCKAFAAAANGMVRSEGAAAVVLKPLSQALADHDRIHAVIAGSAVNQDGRTSGITVPNQQAQESVLRAAYRNANVSPGDVQFVETHGAGTLLGDLIESNALRSLLAENRASGSQCALGSVKTNIGHTEAAAGLAGLIKVALAMQHGQLPPNLHFDQPNPHIAFDEAPFYVQQELGDWPSEDGRRLAGVSSFGFGGTNVHAVLQSPPSTAVSEETERSPDVRLLPLSAANPEGLAAVAAHLEDYMFGADAERRRLSMDDVCYTAAVRRSHLRERAALRFASPAQLEAQLRALSEHSPLPETASGRTNPNGHGRLAFVFSGYGSQWWEMGRGLLRQQAAFREKICECEEALRGLADWSLDSVFNSQQDASAAALEDLEVAQSSLFAFQVALAESWLAWGVVPDGVIGHSMGEVAAAHVAGALDLADAMRVIVHRSRLLKEAARQAGPGAMAALRISGDRAPPACRSIRGANCNYGAEQPALYRGRGRQGRSRGVDRESSTRKDWRAHDECARGSPHAGTGTVPTST